MSRCLFSRQFVSALVALVVLCAVPELLSAETAGTAATIDLVGFAQENDATLYWDSLTQNGLLQKNGHTVSFMLDDRILIVDYSQLTLSDPPESRNGVVYVSRNFTETVTRLFDEPAVSGNFFRVGAILIDPGHGGKDPGAVSTHTINGKETKVQEKDITLAASKKLYALLKEKYPKKNIVLTRSDDRYLSLEQRVEIANSVKLQENEAILYVSIHVNSAFDKKASGFEVWYLSPGYRRTVLTSDQTADKELFPILNSMMEEEYTTESILIAKYISDGLVRSVGQENVNRGIKQEEWFVVRKANMPSVLIELGFLSNRKEAEQMTTESYLNKYVGGIYNGLTSFVTHFEESRGFTGL